MHKRPDSRTSCPRGSHGPGGSRIEGSRVNRFHLKEIAARFRTASARGLAGATSQSSAVRPCPDELWAKTSLSSPLKRLLPILDAKYPVNRSGMWKSNRFGLLRPSGHKWHEHGGPRFGLLRPRDHKWKARLGGWFGRPVASTIWSPVRRLQMFLFL